MFFDTNPDFLDSFFQILIYRCVILTFLVTSDKKSYKRNAAQEERGLVREKANMPHFLVLRHPLPLRNPSPVGRADKKGLLIIKGEIPLSISSRSRDLNEA